MAIALTLREEEELWHETAQNSLQTSSMESLEVYQEMPKLLGNGYSIDVQLHPELVLTILDCEYHDDYLLKYPTSRHHLQFCVLLSGIVKTKFGCLGRKHGYFWGWYSKGDEGRVFSIFTDNGN